MHIYALWGNRFRGIITMELVTCSSLLHLMLVFDTFICYVRIVIILLGAVLVQDLQHE